MTKALIIDDESGAATVLKVKMERNFKDEFQLDMAFGAEEGLIKIRDYKPDLVFLDIEMPMMNGFDLLKALPQINFKVIFTTAYDQYAIRAFRYNALDYLLKPIDTKELLEAVTRFKHQDNREKGWHEQQLANLLSPKEKSIAITIRDGIVFLELDKIIRCEAQLNYTLFTLTDNQTFLSSKTLLEYEDLLTNHTKFIRVHRSHLVNSEYILKYKNGSLVLKDNSVVPTSRRRREEVVRKLKEMWC